jgi:hypothetical protein
VPCVLLHSDPMPYNYPDFVAAPVISSLQPADFMGPTAGDIFLVITGRYFQSQGVVLFGGSDECLWRNVTGALYSSTEIRCALL